MVRPLSAGILLIPLSLSLSGCLALSFGGKTIEASNCGDESRLSSLEARVSSLEQRLGPSLPPPNGMIESHAPPSGTP